MEQCTTLDPYEQQLLKVFDSHDNDNKGSLDKHGLIKLCETLHLEDKCDGLLKSLLDERQTSRATFTEFKDALLRLLGNMQNHSTEIDASPEREVLPKFVYGSKKYGRRSRPRCEELQTKNEENECYLNNNKSPSNTSVQRSNSQCEVSYSKKRKTVGRLKRCTSVPTVSDYQKDDLLSMSTDACTEDMLREVWKKLGVGEDGTLNQTELIRVCDAIGLNKLAGSVIRHLSKESVLEYSKKFSFQELLDVLQCDEIWSEILNSSVDDVSIEDNGSFTSNANDLMNFHNNKVLQHIQMGPDGIGFINSDLIVDLWENAGIVAPKSLLTDLGFNHSSVNIQELYIVLEKEIKGLNELRIDYTNNPHVALLQAFLTLYQIEIKSLKNILEQMSEEKDKLKCDISEANNRASLLAQEVDDNVAKMELNTQKHVKLLEQRHADLLKEVTDQFQTDKEHLALLNQNLEDKIQTLECEELKLRDDLLSAQKYSKIVENENRELNQKISEFQHTKCVLEQHIESLEMDKFKSSDLEKDKRDELVARLSELQRENTDLRDKHDEMISTIETLTNENMLLKSKSSLAQADDNDEEILENISYMYDGIGLGSKRRNGDSPSNELVVLGSSDAESPRLGKIRKFQSTDLQSIERSMSFNESGSVDGDLECSNDGNQITSNALLENKIKFLEELLAKHSIDIPAIDDFAKYDNSKEILTSRYSILLECVLLNLSNQTNTKSLKSDVCEHISCLFNKYNNVETKVQDEMVCDIKNKINNLELENKELQATCEKFESALELLRNEYEKCEDYWQNKLEDERNLFEQEQLHTNEKLSEVLSKMMEYEQQFSQDNRLPAIDESRNLEKQFTDLEQEFDQYKKQASLTLSEKDSQISALRSELGKLSLQSTTSDIGVQVDDEKVSVNLSNHVIEATNLYSSDMMPFSWNNNPTSSIDESLTVIPNNAITDSQSDSKNFSLYELPSTSNSPTDTHTMPVRQKRIRQHNKSMTQRRTPKRNNSQEQSNDVVDYPAAWSVDEDVKENKNSVVNNQKCWIPISILQGLQAKRQHLEQRCKRLQFIMKQQHQYDEQLLNYAWQQYASDKAELQNYIKYYQEKLDQQIRLTKDYQERLAKNDLLVKDFFIDNAYLMAENQRLEQKFHMLTHSMNVSSM